MDFAAELTGMSRRSLQRALALEGSSFSQVLDAARFDRARELLVRGGGGGSGGGGGAGWNRNRNWVLRGKTALRAADEILMGS